MKSLHFVLVGALMCVPMMFSAAYTDSALESGTYISNQAILVVEPHMLDRAGLHPDRSKDRAKLASIHGAFSRFRSDLRRDLRRLRVAKAKFTLLTAEELRPVNHRTGRAADLSFARNWILVDLPSGTDYKQVAQKLRSLPGVTKVIPNRLYDMSAIPADDRYDEQWHFEKIRLPEVWDDYKVEGTLTVGAFEASGIKKDHPDLAPNIHPSCADHVPNYVAHGTKTGGVVAALTNNTDPGTVAGGAWNAKIYISGGAGTGYNTFDILFGVNDLVSDVDVIYYSFGAFGGYGLDVLWAEVDNVGIFQAAAAGNYASSLAIGPDYLPCEHEKVLCVGATGPTDLRWSGSNYGASNMVYAPGENILTTTYVNALGHGYSSDSGTSASAPLVAAVAALMVKKNPTLTPDQIRNILISSADPVAAGLRIDAKDAIDATSSAKVTTSASAVPFSASLGAAHPNPFNSAAVIPFSLSTRTEAVVTIHNLLGQQVRSYDLGALPPGRHAVTWDGRLAGGSNAATGTYIYRLFASGELAARG